MSFGQHLRALLTAAGLSRAEAAHRARVPASTRRGWENDRGFPPVDALLRPVAVLGVSADGFAVIAEPWARKAKKPGRKPKGE